MHCFQDEGDTIICIGTEGFYYIDVSFELKPEADDKEFEFEGKYKRTMAQNKSKEFSIPNHYCVSLQQLSIRRDRKVFCPRATGHCFRFVDLRPWM